MFNRTITSTRQIKMEIIVHCIKSFAPVFDLDYSDNDIKDAMINIMQSISEYPEIEKLKRIVLKKDHPDYYIIQVEKLLRLCISGGGHENTHSLINEALCNALKGLHHCSNE